MEQFQFINFYTTRRGQNASIPENTVRLHFVTKQMSKHTYYSLTFNKVTARILKENQMCYLRLQYNNFTGEIYFVFSKELPTEGTYVQFNTNQRKGAGLLDITNKGLVEFLIKYFGLKEEETRSYDFSIGENLSRTEEFLVFKIFKNNQ